MIKHVVLFVFVFLVGCSSGPVEQVSYYLLSGAQLKKASIGKPEQLKPILIEEIRLADYLKQSNLAIQLNSNQIFYSRQHAWAERLQVGLERALLEDLNSQSSVYSFHSQKSPLQVPIVARLVIQFDHFVATDDSKVIATGSYWVASTAEVKKYTKSSFQFEAELRQDGFAHSIEQLRALVSKLSQQINQQLGT